MAESSANTVTLGRMRFVRESPRYTLAFAAVICVVCALLVSVASVALQPRQERQQQLYLRKNVLIAAGLVAPGAAVGDAEVQRLFDARIEERLVDLAAGALVPREKLDPAAYDARRARADPQQSHVAPDNRAGIRRVANYQPLYLVKKDSRIDQLVMPIEGLGMWGTLYGFISIDADGNTVRGLTYYEQKETPGLGGEVGNPKWQALWRGRSVYDAKWHPSLTVIKGNAGTPEADPLHIDGLSGATVTSNAVTSLMRFWFSEHGYGPFLTALRAGKVNL